MKKNIYFGLISLALLCAAIMNLSLSAHADGSLHWYIKRQVGKPPQFPSECDEISDYGAYYIDKNADESRPVIYLTFDAGYENGNVERILDVLRDEEVPAAFFLLDNIILKNTDLVLRMENEGHLVCNHTKNHKNLSCATEEEIKRNLTALEMIYEEKTGREMAKYFRFPEGSYSIEALKSVNNLGYKTIFWSFAYEDWDNNRQPDPGRAIKKVLSGTHNGAVMLFHPTSETNAEIMKTLIKEWKRMGFSFGTLDELTAR